MTSARGPLRSPRAVVVALAATMLLAGCAKQLPAPRTAEVACAIVPTLVNITTTLAYDAGSGSAATGVVIGSSGQVLTNNHVIASAGMIAATDVGNAQQYSAVVLGTDIVDDLAVLQLRGASGLSVAELGNSSTLAVGDPVYAFGNARGACGPPSLTTGTVRNLNATTDASRESSGDPLHLTGLIESDAPLDRGVSGGPLVNADAQVVGILAAGYEDSDGTYRGYSIPINSAAAVARQILAGRSSANVHIGPAASLGVEAAAAIDLPQGLAATAAIVTRVRDGSPAQDLGLEPGHRITAVDGRRITSARQLTEFLHSRQPGDLVRVSWTDGSGRAHAASTRLATGPPL